MSSDISVAGCCITADIVRRSSCVLLKYVVVLDEISCVFMFMLSFDVEEVDRMCYSPYVDGAIHVWHPSHSDLDSYGADL
jgi:hypothetical protein